MKKIILLLAFGLAGYLSSKRNEESTPAPVEVVIAPAVVCDATSHLADESYLAKAGAQGRSTRRPESRLAQSFQVQTRTKLESVSVYSYWENLNPATASWRVSIYDEGEPEDPESGLLIGTVSTNVLNSIEGRSLHTQKETRPLDFSSKQLILEANVTYWLVLTSSRSNIYFWSSYRGNYKFGRSYGKSIAGSTDEWTQFNGDVFFRINPCS